MLIKYLVNQTRFLLLIIKSTCRCLNDVATVRTLYCALVRFPTGVLYHYLSGHHTQQGTSTNWTEFSEEPQRNSLKTDDDYGTRIEKLNLFSLQDRRFLFNVLFLYKVLNGYIRIGISPFSQFYSDSDWYSLRGRDDCVLKKNFARTDKFSFFNRIVDMWNVLPQEWIKGTEKASPIHTLFHR